jgi:flagellar basal-body rod modification protein FlgD
MAVTSATSATDPYAALNGPARATEASNAEKTADRFLKLLVAQMKNQDPLNPMDNAEVTTQMAQINTVEGITRLNEGVRGLNTQFTQLQAMQGASLLGHEVSVKGDRLALSGEGADVVGRGGFSLAGAADQVQLEVLDSAGRVIATQNLGPRAAGRHDFEWAPGSAVPDTSLRHRIVATRGGSAVAAQPLAFDRVAAVSAGGDGLQLTLQNRGTVAYADVLSVRQGR